MLQKFNFSQPWRRYIIRFVSFILMCLSTLIFLLCIAAFMITRIDTPEYVLIPMTTVLLTFASFIDSFLLARVMRENGLIIGAIVGVIFSFIVFALALYYGTLSFTAILFSKIAAAFFAGILGGILGVNC